MPDAFDPDGLMAYIELGEFEVPTLRVVPPREPHQSVSGVVVPRAKNLRFSDLSREHQRGACQAQIGGPYR